MLPHTHWDGPYPLSKAQDTSVGENLEKWEPLCIVGGGAKWCSDSEKTVRQLLKKLKTESPDNPARTQRGGTRVWKGGWHARVYYTSTHSSPEVGTTQCPLMNGAETKPGTYTQWNISLKKGGHFDTCCHRMNLEDIVLSAINQSPKDTGCMIPLT